MNVTMPEKIDLDEARRLLLQAMQTQGRDFVYNVDGGTCRNVPTLSASEDDPRRKTGCLVGTAMQLSGRIADMQYYAEGSVLMFDHCLTHLALDYFSIAQEVQDGGGTWGDAYDRAEQAADLGMLTNVLAFEP